MATSIIDLLYSNLEIMGALAVPVVDPGAWNAADTTH